MEEKDKTFKPKLRISTLSEQGNLLSDRLVDAATEYYNGPKIQHKGPLRVEVTLTSQQDIDNFKVYLDQLIGNLPIKESSGRGRPSAGAASKAIESPREDILTEVEKMITEGANQPKVIKYLRELGFVFILTEDFKYHFPDFEFDKKDVGEPTDNGQYLNSFSWMVRLLKRAKDPKADKFDPMIIFGFSIMGGPNKKIVPYLYKERKKPLRAETGKKVLTFSQVEFTKLPTFMLEEERIKFSAEQRQLLLNPDKKPSKFFLRWSRDVLLPNAVYEKLKGRDENLKFKNDSIKDEKG